MRPNRRTDAATTETGTASRTESNPDHHATIAEVTIPATDFALGDTITALDGVDFDDVCEQAGLTMDVTRIYALDDGRQSLRT